MLRSILRQRCPRCHEGRTFRSAIYMYDRCPACDLRFEREQGYFVGAMYIAFFLAAGVMAVAAFLFWMLTPLEGLALLWPAGCVLVALAPIVFRYSRVIWMHLDSLIDPLEPLAPITPETAALPSKGRKT